MTQLTVSGPGDTEPPGFRTAWCSSPDGPAAPSVAAPRKAAAGRTRRVSAELSLACRFLSLQLICIWDIN